MIETLLLPALETALRNAGLWRKNAVLLLGLSGGADSVALLHTLVLARERVGLCVCACHVQHNLRGQSTLEDEAFVRSLCETLHVKLCVLPANLDATMETAGVETLARNRRRVLFAECMEAFQADALLLAHHLDDQAETVLMRLLRGAGAKGLCGMRPCAPFGRGVALRPFLGLRKQQLVRALCEAGFSYREDESNAQSVTPRNVLRNELLPQLEALYPEAAKHIAETADSLRDDERCLAALADGLYETALRDGCGIFALEKERLLGRSGAGASQALCARGQDVRPPCAFAQPEPLEAPAPVPAASSPENSAIAVRVLRRFFREGLQKRSFTPDERELSREQSLALLALLTAPSGSALNLPCGLQALCGLRLLYLRMQSGEPLVPFAPPAPVALYALMDRGAPLTADASPVRVSFLGAQMEVARARQPAAPPRDAREIVLPAALLRQCELRAPRAGDRIHPFGASGSKPLRRYLTDRKVDEPLRPSLPVLAVGSRVLWIPALCAAEELRLKPDGEPWRMRLLEDAGYLPNSKW